MIPRRVLVVDDEPAVRHIVRRLLELDGYETLEAESGEEALKVLQSRGADIVLLDVQMPGMSGKTLFHAIRSRWPQLARSIVVMSGDPEAPDIADWITVHGVPVLAKPFGRRPLLDVIQTLPPAERRRANGAD